MIKVIINGNVTSDPVSRAVNLAEGPVTCTTFTVASNGRNGKATFIRVSTWRKLAEICGQYITKGSRVCVAGDNITINSYKGNDGAAHTGLEMTADSVDLPPRAAHSESDDTAQMTQPAGTQAPYKPVQAQQTRFQQVEAEPDLPF